MKKMAELQLTVVEDPRNKLAIQKQIAQWEENLEKQFVDQYRFRCYVASLEGSELPNPKVVLWSFFSLAKRHLHDSFQAQSFDSIDWFRNPAHNPECNFPLINTQNITYPHVSTCAIHQLPFLKLLHVYVGI